MRINGFVIGLVILLNVLMTECAVCQTTFYDLNTIQKRIGKEIWEIKKESW